MQDLVGSEPRLFQTLNPTYQKHVTYVVSASFDLLVETVLIFVPEWRITDQQDVENHTCERRRGGKTREDKERRGTKAGK